MTTPRVGGIQSGPGETPKPRAGRSRYGNLSAQKFQVAHQQVNLDIDFCSKRVFGYTELSIVPTSTSLRAIRLDARGMCIKKVTVNGSDVTDYAYEDLLYINNPKTFEECVKSRIPNIWDAYSSEFSIHQHHLLRQKLSYILGHIDDDQTYGGEKSESLNTEELTILLPENLKLQLADSSMFQQTPSSAIPTTSLTPSHLRHRSGSSDTYNPVQVGIEYELINPKDGLNFVCNPDTDRRMWHVYTSNSEHNVSASSWVPCIDSLLERSIWSFELSIPRSVGDIGKVTADIPASLELNKEISTNTENKETNSDDTKKEDINELTDSDTELANDDEDDDRDNLDLFVCSGDVSNTKEAPHPTDISKKLVSWSVFNPVCAHHIGWAVGAYQSFELSDLSDGLTQLAESEDEFADMEKDETSSSVSLFYLPGQEEVVKNTCIFAQQALDFFSKEYGSYPFSSYGIVFVQGPRYSRNNFAGLSLLSADLLYPPTIIEPMFTTTEEILECIAAQWSGIGIVPLTFNDLWCTIGIAKYMAFQFTKTLVGLNEFKYQIRRKMTAIIEQDIGQRPLGLQAFQAPISEASFDFIRLKAPIILFILDRRMTKTDKSFGFSRVLPKLFLQAMSGDLPNGALSTSHFQYVCEKVNRNRLESFFKQWVFGVGTPIFNITQKFNKKRSLIEVVIRQSQLQQAKTPHPKSETFMRDAVALLNSEQTFPVQQTFLGPMTIRVHEADGTPYEHIVDIKDKVVKFDVQYNTKYKRLKKNKDEVGEGGSVFSKLGDVLQDENDMKKWNFEEWPKRDEEFLDPFEWIRVDTDFEWVATFNLKQPDYMFGAQLQQDRDIEAQIGACEFFGDQEKPSTIHCTVLTRALIDKRFFYGVRIAAAKALADMSRNSNQFIGLDYLMQAFKHLYCFEESSIPKGNNFSDIAEFFVQRELPGILSGVKDEKGNSPMNVKALIYNLVKYNDNSNNDYEDCYYVSNLVSALAKSVIPINEDGSVIELPMNLLSEFENETKDQKFVKKVIEEIERLEKLDVWVPSYQFTVSSACIEQKIFLARSNLYDVSFEELIHATHPKFSPRQRLLAFEGLLLLGGLKNAEILKYFCDVCLIGNSPAHFQSGMINGLVRSISEAAIQGIPSHLDDAEFETVEDAHGSKGKQITRNNMVVVEESQSSEMNSRRDAFARATVKGAIEILRRDLAIGKGLRKILAELLHSSLLSLKDRKSVFLLCDILYEPISSFPVRISVPCVSFEELKKKIVAKVTGDCEVTIKREARFKIQLNAKLSLAETKPRFSLADPKPRISLAEPKLKINIAEPKLKINIAEPKLKINIAEPKLKINIAEPKLKINLSDPKPKITSAETRSDPSLSETNSKSSVTDSKIKTSFSESKPKPSLSENKPKPSFAESQPKPSFSETKPKPSFAESKPKPSFAESKPKPVVSESKPNSNSAEPKPKSSIAENKPNPSIAETKSKPNLSEAKAKPIFSEAKAKPIFSEAKAKPSLFGTKSKPSLSESKVKASLSESKAKSSLSEIKSKSIEEFEKKDVLGIKADTTLSGTKSESAASAAPAKLKLKISAAVVSVPKEENKPSLVKESPILVTRSSQNSMQIKFKLPKAKLTSIKVRQSEQPRAATSEGSLVRIRFVKPEYHQKLMAMQERKKPLRFVKIFTKEKRIEVSREAFSKAIVSESMDSKLSDAKSKTLTGRSTHHRVGKDKDNTRVENSMPGETIAEKTTIEPLEAEEKSTERDAEKKFTEIDADKKSTIFRAVVKKPPPVKLNLFGRAPSEEPLAAMSRAASPFSRDPSPGKSLKKKKAKIYIHGKSSASSSSTPSEKGDSAKSNSMTPAENSSIATKGKVEKSNADASEPGVPAAPADEPRRKLKLKLSIK